MTAAMKLVQVLQQRLLQDSKTVTCLFHLQTLKRKLDLLINDLSHEILIRRVKIIYDYRFRLNVLKTEINAAD